MKKFCRYAVVEVETACLLVCGQKWKDFENSPVRFVKTGTFYRLSIRFHKVTEYFHDIEIRGRHCIIIYWVDERAKKGELYNVVLPRGWAFYSLRGREYSYLKKDYRNTYRRILDSLGVT